MPINPITAYRLAAQAERAHAALEAARMFANDLVRANVRLHADLAAANAKIARMTSGLRQNVKAA